MANIQRNFIKGVMNKSLDERLLPNGQYVDALNVRLGATEDSEIGSVENTKGNDQLTSLEYLNQPLSNEAKCIGAVEDGANETIYWFVHDPAFQGSPTTGKLDLIVSLDVQQNVLTYHVISIDDGGGVNTTLNFNDTYLITGANLIDAELLFFTDNLNPPRFINIGRNYPNPVANIDQITAEQLLVIKKPPINSPGLTLQSTSAQNNFLEDRFVSFGYRYRFADGEYSAVSQFTEPAFVPNSFRYDFATGLNEGMLNFINQATITYDSGSSLVVGIDLLWKDMTNGLIRVIEKLDKSVLGLVDNTEYTYTFSDSKIFTVLPDSEILRLYDNVPRLAQAQTLMGNRLIYGNYLEQYDLVTPAGQPVLLEYTVEKVNISIGLTEIETSETTGSYTIDSSLGPQSILNSRVDLLDVDSLNLQAGSAIDIQIKFEHSQFTGQAPFPANTTTEVEINFQYILPQDFASANELATSVDFVEKIGTAANIETVANACDGVTLTDEQNCIIPQTLDGLTKFESGVNQAGQGILIFSSPGSPNIGLQLVAMRFVDDPTGVAITQEVFEYYQVSFAGASFQETGNPKSLHSDRNYEIGIVYMDDFNRASTALVSLNNTVNIPCADSDQQNKIRATIPIQQIAPAWATRYKFCIKQDKENYFNVYSSFFFRDPTTSADYFLIEGQNTRKVEEGDLLKVKTDTVGALNRCAFATVLEKKSQTRDFLDPKPVDANDNELVVPPGTYMKIRANTFSTTLGDNPVITFGEKSKKDNNCPVIDYPVQIEDVANPGTYIDYTIPAGSRIRILIDNFRRGNEDKPFGNVAQKKWFVDADFTASQDYSNFKDFFDGDNIAPALEAQATTDGTGVSGPNYNPVINAGFLSCETSQISCFFKDNGLNAADTFSVRSSKGYNGKNKETKLKVLIDVVRSSSFIAFETQPQDAVPDVWYISPVSYPIAQPNTCQFSFFVSGAEVSPIQFDYDDIYGISRNVTINPGGSKVVLGECNSAVISPSTPPSQPTTVITSISLPHGAHAGNVQNQTPTQPAIIDTAFFNCYSFGNGVESYQIRDGIGQQELAIGNQVTSTSAQDYQEVRRFADLTYSGVFNDESNVNKLNEFNLGLLNFKPLEEEFGPVMKLDGRETDILTLQEDKISFVLAGKNLLTDSTGGSTVASIPEVLGTQVARIEEYGISFHPESYAKWGPNKFFTDAKRGAVIQLRGTAGQNEALNVISEAGMRSWFRDLFLESFNTQKLGAWDPYHNEYVLSSNNELLPQIVECIECGITRTLNVTLESSSDFCVDVGTLVGEVLIEYNVIGAGQDDFVLNATYDGQTFTTGVTGVSGSLTVPKNNVTEESIELLVTSTGSTLLEVTVNCPDAQEITIIQVCLSVNGDGGQFIHNEYRWVDGVFTSPLQSEQVELVTGTNTPLVSQFTQIVGAQGGGFIPADNADVSIISNRILPIDDFVFDPLVDKLRYLRTNTFYANTPGDITALLAASNNATPITGGPNTYEAQFTMPNTNDQYLYIIYDYRNGTAVELCYDANTAFAACCECGESVDRLLVRQCREDGTIQQFVIDDNLGLSIGDFVELVGYPNCIFQVSQTTQESVNASVNAVRNDITDCTDVCQEYNMSNTDPQATLTVDYVDCEGANVSEALPPGGTAKVCMTELTTIPQGISLNLANCQCTLDPDQMLVQQCRQDGQVVTEVVTQLVNETIGDFVELTGYPDCVFEITSIVQDNSTDTISAVRNDITDCTDVCQTYRFNNTSGGPIVNVPYTDCNGDPQEIPLIEAGGFEEVCATEIPPVQPVGIEVGLISCTCDVVPTEFLEVRICDAGNVPPDPSVVTTHVVESVGGAIVIGQIVEINGCSYRADAIVAGPATAVPTQVFPIEITCQNVCHNYEVTFLTGGNFGYVQCDGTILGFTAVESQVITRCIKEVYPPGITAQYEMKLIGCECTEFRQASLCENGTSVDPSLTQNHIVENTLGASQGDLVTIDGCHYTIQAITDGPATATIGSLVTGITCDDICQEYQVFWISDGQVSYVNCFGNTVTESQLAGFSGTRCIKTFNPPATTATYNAVLQQCCCEGSCKTYEYTNTTQNNITIQTIDCDDTPILRLIVAGQTVTECDKQYTPVAGITVNELRCGCAP